ncbi:MAG: hypothetical protein KKA60_11935 [Proteobacteria bacterium]|nr:hypothetical protein [Pseudomonadota bacterium]
MDPETIFRQLKELAESLGIAIRERVLGPGPIRVQSGLCRVRGNLVLVLDRKLVLREKIAILAESINAMATDEIFVVPALREALDEHPASPRKTIPEEHPDFLKETEDPA